jgi:hypothetical protein
MTKSILALLCFNAIVVMGSAVQAQTENLDTLTKLDFDRQLLETDVLPICPETGTAYSQSQNSGELGLTGMGLAQILYDCSVETEEYVDLNLVTRNTLQTLDYFVGEYGEELEVIDLNSNK